MNSNSNINNNYNNNNTTDNKISADADPFFSLAGPCAAGRRGLNTLRIKLV